jgi:hypothetical protein
MLLGIKLATSTAYHPQTDSGGDSGGGDNENDGNGRNGEGSGR